MWNHDLSHAPRDGSHVILAMPNKTTLRSYWCEPKGEPAHWCMLRHKNVPVAWMPWPDHPHNMRDGASETMGGLPVPAASGTAERTGRNSVYTKTGRHGTPHVSGVTGGESAATQFYLEDAGGGA